jgi:IS5 family transposase
MEPWDHLGPCRIFHEENPPMPDNENLRLLTDDDWMTPAEVMQWARRRKERLIRELAADARLWTCPEHRRTWNATLGIEQLTRRQCFAVR